jgi:hypothetical protein
VTCLILCVSGILVWHGDHHGLNRGGATLAAIGAFSALIEFRIERQVSVAEEHKTVPGGRSSFELALAMSKLDRWISDRKTSRRDAIVTSGIFVGVGELLHGWGDLIVDLFCKMASCCVH